MESVAKPTQQKKRRETRIQSVYSRCLITRKIVLPITSIGKNLQEVVEENIKANFEGRCVVEGYIKPNSSKIITYSSGIIERGNNISFDCGENNQNVFPSHIKIDFISKLINIKENNYIEMKSNKCVGLFPLKYNLSKK